MQISENNQINARVWRRNYKSLFPWNIYQLDLFDHLEKPSGNIAVRARAGSGKTTTIAGCIAALPSDSKIAVFAFNKHIADKLKADPRIPTRVRCGTAHSFGNALLTACFGGRQPQLDTAKTNKIAKGLVEKIIRYRSQYNADKTQFEIGKMTEEQLKSKWGDMPPPSFNESGSSGRQELKLFIRFVRDVASYAMKTLTPVNDLKALAGMVSHFEIEQPESPDAKSWGLRAVKHAISEGERIAVELNIISFDEMLYLPYKWQITPPKKDWIIVDEAQDASPAQAALYKSYCDQGAKIVYVGDDKQAIMGFSGADSHSWINLAATFNPKELPLSICYRCPSSHLDLARRIVPDIEPRPDAPKGKIEVIHPKALITAIQPGDLGISRLTSPLISTCLKLLANGKPAFVRGRAIGEQLTAIASKARAYINWPTQFKDQIDDYINKLLRPAIEEDNEEQIERLTDQRTALFSLWESYNSLPSFEVFIEKIESLFDDEDRTGTVTLSTIHRAKGDEAERVFIIGSQLLPFTFKASQDWQIEQEMNIAYVALTRAKAALFLVPFPRSKKDDEEKLKEWLEHPLGGMDLPESISSKKQFDPLDLHPGAIIKARNLEWELNGFDFEESGDIYLLLSRDRSSATARVIWEECQVIKNSPDF
jgi:superfamily I DNA/RNA helicase